MTFTTWIDSDHVEFFMEEELQVEIDVVYSNLSLSTGGVRVLYRGVADITRAFSPDELSKLAHLAGEKFLKEKVGA